MLHFYKNFNVQEDGTLSFDVRGMHPVLDAKLLGEILNVLLEGFDTYVRREWLNLEEK